MMKSTMKIGASNIPASLLFNILKKLFPEVPEVHIDVTALHAK